MEFENPKTQCLNSDIISSLPQNVIESILSQMSIRDAVRTSILSKKWRYCWHSMPKLALTDGMVELPSKSDGTQLMKYKLATAIFHVLLSHNGPEILEFNYPVSYLHLETEVTKITSYLAKGDKLKKLIFSNDGADSSSYKLPVSFFSLQGLEVIDLQNCIFEPPMTFNGFSRLTTVKFVNIEVSAQTLQRFLSKCPLIENIYLDGCPGNDYTVDGNKITFVDLLRCVPLIKTFDVSEMYGGEKVPVQQTPNYFLDQQNHPDLNLDHLEILKIDIIYSKPPLVVEFVKLIMAKSPVLRKVQIHLNCTVDEELKMLRDMLLLSFPRASPFAKLIIEPASRL